MPSRDAERWPTDWMGLYLRAALSDDGNARTAVTCLTVLHMLWGRGMTSPISLNPDGCTVERYACFPTGPADGCTRRTSRKLAAASRVSRSLYASPLCAPGRAAFYVGGTASATGVYDKRKQNSSSEPTLAHHCAAQAIRPACRQVHFVGPTSCTVEKNADHRYLPRRFGGRRITANPASDRTGGIQQWGSVTVRAWAETSTR